MKVITAVFGNQKLFEKDDKDSLIAIKVADVVYFYETLHGGIAQIGRRFNLNTKSFNVNEHLAIREIKNKERWTKTHRDSGVLPFVGECVQFLMRGVHEEDVESGLFPPFGTHVDIVANQTSPDGFTNYVVYTWIKEGVVYSSTSGEASIFLPIETEEELVERLKSQFISKVMQEVNSGVGAGTNLVGATMQQAIQRAQLIESIALIAWKNLNPDNRYPFPCNGVACRGCPDCSPSSKA